MASSEERMSCSDQRSGSGSSSSVAEAELTLLTADFTREEFVVTVSYNE